MEINRNQCCFFTRTLGTSGEVDMYICMYSTYGMYGCSKEPVALLIGLAILGGCGLFAWSRQRLLIGSPPGP